MVRRDFFFSLDFDGYVKSNGTGHGRFVRPFLCGRKGEGGKYGQCYACDLVHVGGSLVYLKSPKPQQKHDKMRFLPRLYHTSISPLSVRTSIIVWPRKSSDSRLSFWIGRKHKRNRVYVKSKKKPSIFPDFNIRNIGTAISLAGFSKR